MKTYEGMFVLDAGGGDFEAAAEPVRQVLDRLQAEVLALKPWDERRLAYPLRGRKRGLYVLTYFRADPARMGELNHEVQLSEKILRAMVLSADHVKEEKIKAETPATLARTRRAAADAQRAAREREKAAAEAASGGQGGSGPSGGKDARHAKRNANATEKDAGGSDQPSGGKPA